MPPLSIHHRFAVSCQAESTESGKFDDAAESKDSPKKHSFFVATSIARLLQTLAPRRAPKLEIRNPKSETNPKFQEANRRPAYFGL
jgi:hypothetical protein